MLYYTVYYRQILVDAKGVSLITKDVKSFLSERRALIECIIDNFIYIEENDPFYDPEDQQGNNYFYRETPQFVLRKYGLNWETPQSLRSFNELALLSTKDLNDLMYIQKQIIVPTTNKTSWLFSHKYTCLKTYKYNILTR